MKKKKSQEKKKTQRNEENIGENFFSLIVYAAIKFNIPTRL